MTWQSKSQNFVARNGSFVSSLCRTNYESLIFRVSYYAHRVPFRGGSGSFLGNEMVSPMSAMSAEVDPYPYAKALDTTR